MIILLYLMIVVWLVLVVIFVLLGKLFVVCVDVKYIENISFLLGISIGFI